MRISDWSSDVCSSDLGVAARAGAIALTIRARHADREGAVVIIDRAVRRFLGKPEQRPRVDRPADGVIHVALDEGDVAERAERTGRLRQDRAGQNRKSTRVNSSQYYVSCVKAHA